MTENLAAGLGEGLQGLVGERDRINAVLAEFSAKGRDCYESMPYVVGKRDGMNCAIAALEAAAPPSTAPANEHELLVGGIVRVALELAILRGDLRMDSGDAFEEMSESEREDVISDTWNAMNGEGTCDDEPVKELTAIYAALATPAPQAPPASLIEASKNLLEACYQADALEELPQEIDGSLLDAVRDGLLVAAAATQEQPAGSGVTLDRERCEGLYLKFSEPLMEPHTPVIIERVNGDCTVSQFIIARDEAHGLINQLCKFLHVGSPRKVGEDGAQIIIDCLRDHWPTWIDGESSVEQIGVCSCGKAKANGVRKYQQIWSEHMGELVRDAQARSSSAPVGEQKQEDGV